MIKLKIDNINCEAIEGSTILETAIKAGKKIPTLCHKTGMPHYSSCMVCMVKDRRTNSFLPSCSALVQDEMDIDASGEDVISLRKKAIELLLTEHRAECEAPCHIVCPAGYDIPGFNRLLSVGDIDAAKKLTLEEVNNTDLHCRECKGYCENACRRKKVDIPVSIRNLKLFIFSLAVDGRHQPSIAVYLKETEEGGRKKTNRPFTSLIGRLDADELQEWLKECPDDIVRFRDINDNESASAESHSCMHCDCRAKDDCRLRDLSEEFKIINPRGKIVNSPIQKKININTGLIFENAKCIKCGLCVRLCEDSKDEPALCFINRGFVSIISEPLTEDFNNILLTKSREVAEICPTGALSIKTPCPAAQDIPQKGE